jgi:hypothetical protein
MPCLFTCVCVCVCFVLPFTRLSLPSRLRPRPGVLRSDARDPFAQDGGQPNEQRPRQGQGQTEEAQVCHTLGGVRRRLRSPHLAYFTLRLR